MYKCNICNGEFISTKALGGHQRAHSSKTPLGGDILKSILRAKLKRERNIYNYEKTPLICKNCNTSIPYDSALSRKSNRNYKEYKNIFCTQSCAAKYNNTHKATGTRRSKLEVWLEEQLTLNYSDLEIHFNRKDAIESELDIYIPSMKLAFELNGIYHYEPIHGKELLEKIRNNDNRKFQACLERDIELCIIDSSKLVYFKESSAKVFLNIIVNILDNKMVSLNK